MNTTIFFIIYILLYKTVVGTVQNSIGSVEWLTLQPYEVPLAFQLPDGLQSSWYIFICRTNYGNNQLVGRLLFHYERIPTCHFAYDGSELNQPDFQVVSSPPGSLSWQDYDGHWPENAIVGGYISGKKLYVCRSIFSGLLLIGYVYEEMDRCIVSYWEQHVLYSFEILVKNEYGMMMQVLNVFYLSGVQTYHM